MSASPLEEGLPLPLDDPEGIRARVLSLVAHLAPSEIVFSPLEFVPAYLLARRMGETLDLWLSDFPPNESEGIRGMKVSIEQSESRRPDRLNREKYGQKIWEDFSKNCLQGFLAEQSSTNQPKKEKK